MIVLTSGGFTELRCVKGEVNRYTIDYSRYLVDAEVVTSLTLINVDAGIGVTVENETTFVMSSPSAGVYEFALKATTDKGRVRVWPIRVRVHEDDFV